MMYLLVLTLLSLPYSDNSKHAALQIISNTGLLRFEEKLSVYYYF